MVKQLFKPEDFQLQSYADQVAVAHSANSKLQKLIESWPVVYGSPSWDNWWNTNRHQSDSHRAFLAFVENVECRHEPAEFKNDGMKWKASCKYCGAELVAQWSVKV